MYSDKVRTWHQIAWSLTCQKATRGFFVFSQQVCWSELASDFLVLAYLTIVEEANAATCGLRVQRKNEIASLEVNLNMTVLRVKVENGKVGESGAYR